MVDDKKRHGTVMYATKSDPLLALEPVLWLCAPDGSTFVVEPVGLGSSEPCSAVEAVLAAAGCLPSTSNTALELKVWSDENVCIRHYGFDVEEARWESVMEAVNNLSGNLGGWSSVLVGQTAFHAPTHMVQILGVIWNTAGRPNWIQRQQVSATPTRVTGAPSGLLEYTAFDHRANVLAQRFVGLDTGKSDGLTVQRTHLDVQDPVEIAPETCEFCGGRLYQVDEHFFCAEAALLASSPDFEDS